MKKVMLLSVLFLAVNFLNAQSNGDREKRLAIFVNQANLITSNTTDVSQRENRIVRLAGSFLADYRSKDEVKEMKDFENNLLTCHQCDPVKIKKYLALITERNGSTSFVSQETINSLRANSDDKELSAAIQIYEEVGARNLGDNTVCATGNCDNDKHVNPKSRGQVADIWMYTGEKKFFVEDDMKGWRYYCKHTRANADDPLNTHTEKDEYGWKKAENVDKW